MPPRQVAWDQLTVGPSPAATPPPAPAPQLALSSAVSCMEVDGGASLRLAGVVGARSNHPMLMYWIRVVCPFCKSISTNPPGLYRGSRSCLRLGLGGWWSGWSQAAG